MVAVSHQCGAQDVDRHSEVGRRHVVAGRLLVEHALVFECEPTAPVFDRERDAGVTGVEDLLLERLELPEALRPLVGEFLDVCRLPALDVLDQPRPRLQAVLPELRGLGVILRHEDAAGPGTVSAGLASIDSSPPMTASTPKVT